MTGEKVNFEQVKEQVEASDSASRKNERSTIDFPYLPLETAVEVASAVYSRNGLGSCEVDELAAEMNQTVSGAFRQKTAAAKTFGVVEKDGRSAFKLSDLGRRIIDEDGAAAAKVDAFFAVPLYSAIYDNYKGQKLPPTKALEREMQSLGVAPKQADRARQAFERSAHYAGMNDAGSDRLVKPNLSSVDSTVSVDDQSAVDSIGSGKPHDESNDHIGNGNGSGGGGNLPPDVDPIIAGLIARLPKSGAQWPTKERELWLGILKSSFDLVYTDVRLPKGIQDEIDKMQ